LRRGKPEAGITRSPLGRELRARVFLTCWEKEEGWTKIEIPATQVARISQKYLDEERRALGTSFFRRR
jgi:hypothetical protein